MILLSFSSCHIIVNEKENARPTGKLIDRPTDRPPHRVARFASV